MLGLYSWIMACGAAMHAHERSDAGSYGPEALKAMCQAFDAAWGEIAGNFGADGPAVALARLKLANAVLSTATTDSRDVQVLKRAALLAMAEDYRLPMSGISASLVRVG